MNQVILKFSDDTEITCEQNGDCFITDKKPNFPKDFSKILVYSKNSIDSNESEESNESDRLLKEINFAELIECASVDERYWFSFREMSQSEIEQSKISAQVLYTALITDSILT